MLAGIDAISFDVGGTLIEPFPSVGHVYATVAAESGFPGIPPDRVTERFVAAWKTRRAFAYSREEWAELVQASLAGWLPAPEITLLFPRIYDRFLDPSAWRVYPDVLPALDRLEQLGIPLAVTSNWDERLGPLLRALDLERRFAVCTISRELGVHKPDPAIFHHTCERLRLPPSRVLHIGDSTREDIDGARAAGLRAARVDRAAGTDMQAGVLGSLLAMFPGGAR